MLAINNLFLFLLQGLHFALVEMKLKHGDTHRMIFEADFAQISKHHSSFYFLHRLAFQALKLFLCLFNVFEEAYVLGFELKNFDEVDLGLLDFSEVVIRRSSPSNALYVSWVDEYSFICVIKCLCVRLELEVSLRAV